MASAASTGAQLFLLFSTHCFLLPLTPDAKETNNPKPLSFSFDFSNASSYDAGDLKFEGNASVHGDRIDLACISFGQSAEGCTGRMSYNHPVPFYDNGGVTTTTALPQVASFSTSFTFVIKPDGEPAPGDGLAFFICGYPSRMPANTDGGSLGLMDNDATAYGSGQFVAVEFDTYKNDDWGDPSDDHIGVDVNTVRSSNTTELNITTPSSGLPMTPISLKANATMTATIRFDGATGMLAASLRFHDHPSMEPAVVTYVLQDPKALLPREVAVGFSAGTGTSTQLHQILAWSFNSTTLAAPITPPPPPKGWQNVNYAGHKSMVVAIAVVVPILALFICGIVSFKIIKKNRKGEVNVNVNVNEEDEALVWVAGRRSEFMVYNFLQVLEATNNFSEENKLGQGGFGPVYKGRFRDGSEIAAKRLASHSGQGFREFKNEIELIAKLQHTNLVRLLGCCCQGDERLLIYEYMPNKSLDFYIFDEIQRVLLDWNKRLAIIEGIAQGILYLHKHSRLRVIHRDLKASNILLDHEMNPKISDFGLAKIFSLNGTEGNTNRIVGTYGYMAPEYASEGLFSIKSDVFSFGVLTLEIISGKRTSNAHQYGDFINLLGYAWQLWVDGLGLQLVDTSLGVDCHALMMMRCINIALLCVQENAVDRPTMSEVAAMLCSDSIILPEPKHPAYFHVRVGAEDEASAETSGVNDVTISAIDGR